MTNTKKKFIEVVIPPDAINATAGAEHNIHIGLPANRNYSTTPTEIETD
jgi:hypothetical protein